MMNTSLKWPEKFPVGIVIALIGVFYFIYFPVNYDFDGTVFSHFLRYGMAKGSLASIHQPQHPLYMPFNYFLYKSLNALFGYNALEYFHLQLCSFFFGLLTLLFSYKILKTTTDSPFYQTAGILLIAFSYGIWYYSVEAEVHMPGIFFITAGMYFLGTASPGIKRIASPGAAALCFALAAGFHLTNGLITISALLVFIIQKWRFSKIARFFAAYGFFLALELSIFSLLSGINLFEFYKNQLHGPDVLAGYKISYWHSFSPGGLWEFFQSTANAVLFPGISVLSFVSVLLFIIAAVFIIYRCFKSIDKKCFYIFGFWMLPYIVFFMFWDRRNIEFKLNIILPFIILLIGALSSVSWKKFKALPLIVMVLILSIGVSNFYSYMLPANNLENNRSYRVAESIGNVTPPQSIIVISGCGTDLSIHQKIYIPYFAQRRVFILDWMLGRGLSFEQVRAQIVGEMANGIAVYFFSDALEDGKALETMLKNHNLGKPGYLKFLMSINATERIPVGAGYYLRRVGR